MKNKKKKCDFSNLSLIFRNIQLEVTSKCNMKCFNCDRSCGQAPAEQHMTIDQISSFTRDVIKNGWWFDRVDIIGGEPTLHPNFFDVINEMSQLRKYLNNRKCKFRLSTNGVSDYTKDVLSKVPDWIKIRNSNKKDGQGKFDSYNKAPIDFDIENAPVCDIPWRCGFALTPYGYYPCGAGGGLDRVFRFDVGIKDLSSFDIPSVKKQMDILCRYCGHSPTSILERTEKPVMSKSWIEAYKNYNSGEIKEMKLIYI